ncbi:heme NO-binding domain-containing protein [Arthrobacter sp. CG_A4]|uniref:heme NO-binding domain-containing protein n=1 Tax=Arthrobacter sp. CG_A4 TaxID=3071706 RepID=UPI002E007947|nr:hypothetical protein [Arthrobacter sp. CG_A4]
MKGIIFNLLEEVVIQHHGEDTWDDLLDGAGFSGSYTSLGSYPDEDALRLVSLAAESLNSTPFDILRWFGQEAMPLLAVRYPGYFRGHATTRPFVLSVNSIIHPEVRMIYPGADVPTFGFRDEPDGSLEMTYSSARRLCALAHGFLEGAAAHYGETVDFDQLQCMNLGAASCVCRVTFHGAKPA